MRSRLIAGQESDQADAIFGAVIASAVAGMAAGWPKPHLHMLHDGRDSLSLQQFAETFRGSAANGEALLELHRPESADAVILECWQRLKARERRAEGPAAARLSEKDAMTDVFGTPSGSAFGTSDEVPAAEAPDDDGHPVLLLIRNIGQFRSLRREEDDFGLGSFGGTRTITPASRLGDLIRHGPQFGIHLVLWSDTFSNVIRWLSTASLKEFDYRVAFRLNQTDSASLLETPAAASLGSGRAILYQDQTGNSERFRPWVWPLTFSSETRQKDRIMPSQSPQRVSSIPVQVAETGVENDLPDIDDLQIE